MKNREETKNSIYEKSREAFKVQKRRKKRIIVAATTACLALVIGIGVSGLPRELLVPIINSSKSAIDSPNNEDIKNGENFESHANPEAEGNNTNIGEINDKFGEGVTDGVDSEYVVPERVYIEKKLSETAVNLMDGLEGSPLTSTESSDSNFVKNSADFALRLFKESADTNSNSIISPISVMIALSMVANGAEGETLAQMEALIAGDKDLDWLNENINQYVSQMKTSEHAKVALSDSIWFRDNENLLVRKEFLEKNAKYYHSDIYKAPFNTQTVKDINAWIYNHTDGLIEKMVEEINEDTMMYLFNTIFFEVQWKEFYHERSVRDEIFTAADGTEQKASMMVSTEREYLENENATGFVKDMEEGYKFIALLPKEGVSMGELVESLSGESFLSLFENCKQGDVHVKLPKFTAEYSVEMNDVLKNLGMTDAFDRERADFTGLGSMADGNHLYIGEVLHKTKIEVTETGVRAAAATEIDMLVGAMPPQEEFYVTLDRPFVYAVVDENNLPLFLGVLSYLES